MISESSIERIRSLDIVDVIGRYIDLQRKGASFRASSPFTNEKTPSFYVVPSKQLFKCFSSGHGGDAIKFVMLKENVSFAQAVEMIAQKVGERIEYETTQTKEQVQHTDKLCKVNEAAAKRFYNALLDTDQNHPAFQEVVIKRRFTDDTILQWQIGYAPNDWKFLTKHLVERGLVAEAKELGLVDEKDGNVFDYFRDRVMYPVHDHHGHIVAFGGRLLSKDGPKYMNSRESPLYYKSQVLFGLYFAAPAIRKHKYAYLVEGYTDVVSFHQAGFNVTVAPCGTSLTDEQCKLLKRYCSKVVLFPDPDEAGERAAMRNIDLLMSHGFETAIVPMPHVNGRKVDPDELARSFDLNKDVFVNYFQ